MRSWLIRTLVLIGAATAPAAVRYVSPTGSHEFPYTNWATAAQDIQSAMDASQLGDTVFVTNGVYETGSRVWGGGTPNRVVLTNGVRLESINGPETTIIRGTGPTGTNAVRCVLMTSNTYLSGFTLTNGYTLSSTDKYGGGARCDPTAVISNCLITGNQAERGGGVWGGTVLNSVLRGNGAGAWGGGAYQATLVGCRVETNTASSYGGGVCNVIAVGCSVTANWTASFGGGACASSLRDCTVARNYAGSQGGGAYRATLDRSLVAENWASAKGGGAYDCTITRCTLTSNSAPEGGGVALGNIDNSIICSNWAGYGGGAYNATVRNSMLLKNRCTSRGGGADGCTLRNCVLVGNVSDIAHRQAGGANLSSLESCTVVSNSAASGGGGILHCSAVNCIIYFNHATNGAPDVDGVSTLDYSCSSTDPGGTGNTTNNPSFHDSWYLRADSPCLNAGSNAEWMTTATDFAGAPRIFNGRVDMGAIEGSVGVSIAPPPGLPALSSWDVVPGGTYQIEECNDMVSQDWTPVGSPLTSGTRVVEFELACLTNSTFRAYRLLWLQD